MGRRKPIAIEEVQRRVRIAHGDDVKIVPETYVGVRFKAMFEDKDFGRWEAFVTNVALGHGHKQRSAEKTAKTCMERYGSTTPLGSPKVREKIEATNVVRYGNRSSQGSPLVRAKSKATMVERYGVDNPQKIPEVRARTLATNVERYGVEHPYQSPEIMAKMGASNVEKYGVENPMQREDVKERGRQTCLERYGVENPAQSPEIYQKTLDGMHQVTKLEHWKTGETLSCHASYEAAFVEWCNKNKIDFDWQVPFKTPILTPNGRQSVYFIDAYVKSGKFANVWIELKGTFNRKNGHIGKAKWEWFHIEYPNSLLCTGDVLKQMGVLGSRGVMTKGVMS